MNREQILPEPKRFRRESAGLVVGRRNLGLIVVHNAGDPDQRLVAVAVSLQATGHARALGQLVVIEDTTTIAERDKTDRHERIRTVKGSTLKRFSLCRVIPEGINR